MSKGELEGNGVPPEVQDEDKKSLTRGKFLAGAGVAGAGLALGSVPAMAKPWSPQGRNKALKSGLAPGKYGGPTGFAGAERYQYPKNSAEARARDGLIALKKAGRVPDPLVVQILDGAQGHMNVAFPKGAPTALQLLEKETGIKVKLITFPPQNEYTINLRNASTKNSKFHLVSIASADIGDFASAGLLANLDPYVSKYKPDWTDPKYGYSGGPVYVALLNKYNGSVYAVSFDNDTQPWAYRSDLFNDPKEKAAFENKYGQKLEFPKTWDDHAKVAAFFTRPDQRLYGSVECLSPFWGTVNWFERYVCSAYPAQYYFSPTDGRALIGGAAGIRATEDHVKSLEWHEPGALTKIWIDSYATLGDGGVMGGEFPNVTKLVVKANKQLDRQNVGRFLRTEIAPGRIVGNKLVRRPVIAYNIAWGVNGFIDKKYREAAYLFTQYFGSARIYTWITQNPAGYMDPNRDWSLDDPNVRASYKPQAADKLKEVTRHTAPLLTYRGAAAYQNALDTNLQKALTKQLSPEQAIKNAAQEWEKITDRLGREKQIAALKASLGAWSKVYEKA